MKIVIDIPESIYETIKEEEVGNSVYRAIKNGAPFETVTEFADRCKECGSKYGKLLKTGQFAEWVASEIFDDNWEYNKDAFAEIACRKLAKLGIVRAKGDEWELVEPQESEEENRKTNANTCSNLDSCENCEYSEGDCCRLIYEANMESEAFDADSD